jgi:plastocyanin
MRAIALSPLFVICVLAVGPSKRVDSQQASVDTTVVVRSEGPNLEFLPARIAVKNGLKLRVRYVNDGLLPHNIVFPRDENDIDDLAMGAAESAATGYVPLGQKEKLFAYSTLAKPAETRDLVFTVPPPGEYRFVCLYPGHQNAMVGTLRSLR